MNSLNLQEQSALFRGASRSMGVVARACPERSRSINGLFESLLAEAFDG